MKKVKKALFSRRWQEVREMLDIKFVREHLDDVKTMLKHRCNPLSLDDFEVLEKRRRAILGEVEGLKGERNAVSKTISQMKKNGEDAAKLVEDMRGVGDRITVLDEELRSVEARLKEILLNIPNMPKDDVPIGKDDTENPEIRRWGEPVKFPFAPKAHWDLGKIWISLTLSGPPRCPGRGSPSTKGWGRGWSAPVSTS